MYLRCFLFLLPNYISVYVILMQKFPYLDKRGVLQQEHSQPPILPSPHFQWVVIHNFIPTSIVVLIIGRVCRAMLQLAGWDRVFSTPVAWPVVTMETVGQTNPVRRGGMVWALSAHYIMLIYG